MSERDYHGAPPPAVTKGELARIAGKPASSNPYSTVCARANWLSGWLRADERIRAKRERGEP